jgi:hypothetical protein
VARSSEQRMRFEVFGMLFGVGISAIDAAVLSVHRNGSGPASPGTTRETAAPLLPRKSGQKRRRANRSRRRVLIRIAPARRVTSRPAAKAMSRQRARPAAPTDWWAEKTRQMGQVLEKHGTDVPENPAPATSPRPALEHTKPVASQRSAAAADRPNTKLGRPYAGGGSSGHNGFWAWSR